MGELVVSWNQEDYQCYNKRRLFADSVLQMLQLDYGAPPSYGVYRLSSRIVSG